MEMSSRELWTLLHGMILGAMFLLAFSGGLVCLLDFGQASMTLDQAVKPARRLMIWTCAMSLLLWITVLLGTYQIYPWYRAKHPDNTDHFALEHYPKYFLLSSKHTAQWHYFGMEWKEHIAWIAAILATSVAFIATCHWRQLQGDKYLRRAVVLMFTASFFCAAIAGALGALINKVAPTR